MMEHILIVSYVEAVAGDVPCLIVCRRQGDRLYGVKSFYATEAEQLYEKLTGQEGPSNLIAISTASTEKHFLKEILDGQQTPQRNTGSLLHNKDCAYGYRCKAVACMECMEIYARERGQSE